MYFIDIFVYFIGFYFFSTQLKPQIMKTIDLNAPTQKFNHIASIACKVFGHKYRITKRYESNTKEFECAHCKKQYTLDGYGHYTPLTPKLRNINEVFEDFYIRKLARTS